MKKTLFTATLLAASLMAASTVQAAPQEVTMWHYFDQKPEQEMLADMVEEYNSGKDKAFNGLVGQVMKASKGKANPAQVNELMNKLSG